MMSSFAEPNLDQEVIDSRSSTPLEEEDYRASEPLLKIKYDTGRPLTRPRCRDYDGNAALELLHRVFLSGL